MSNITFDIIGTVHSPYKEKFAIPRQPGLVKSARGRIELLPQFGNSESVRDLRQFSHIWVLFVFHGTQQQGWKPLVRPPRLGGNAKTGVFATRSTFRPNPIGMSAVQLHDVIEEGDQVFLEIGGLDLLDQTPVVDIKPYLPYSDSPPNARAGFATEKPPSAVSVTFSAKAEQNLSFLSNKLPLLRDFIEEVLSQDPRPAYKRDDTMRQYGVRLYDFNIIWEAQGNSFLVTQIDRIKEQ